MATNLGAVHSVNKMLYFTNGTPWLLGILEEHREGTSRCQHCARLQQSCPRKLPRSRQVRHPSTAPQYGPTNEPHNPATLATHEMRTEEREGGQVWRFCWWHHGLDLRHGDVVECYGREHTCSCCRYSWKTGGGWYLEQENKYSMIHDALGEQNRTEHCCRKNRSFQLTQNLTDLNKNYR